MFRSSPSTPNTPVLAICSYELDSLRTRMRTCPFCDFCLCKNTNTSTFYSTTMTTTLSPIRPRAPPSSPELAPAIPFDQKWAWCRKQIERHLARIDLTFQWTHRLTLDAMSQQWVLCSDGDIGLVCTVVGDIVDAQPYIVLLEEMVQALTQKPKTYLRPMREKVNRIACPDLRKVATELLAEAERSHDLDATMQQEIDQTLDAVHALEQRLRQMRGLLRRGGIQ